MGHLCKSIYFLSIYLQESFILSFQRLNFLYQTSQLYNIPWWQPQYSLSNFSIRQYSMVADIVYCDIHIHCNATHLQTSCPQEMQVWKFDFLYQTSQLDNTPWWQPLFTVTFTFITMHPTYKLLVLKICRSENLIYNFNRSSFSSIRTCLWHHVRNLTRV